MQHMAQILSVSTETSMQNCRLQSIWTQHELHAGHILCKEPCIKQDHQDKKWKYRQKQLRNHIDIDGEHTESLAEIIVYGKTKVVQHWIPFRLGKPRLRQGT
eukprot:16451516-Heterocapsa_arctica.AAC.1